jgi:predicted transcriptional regulator
MFGDFIGIQDHYCHQDLIIEDHHYHITTMGIDILETISSIQEIMECRDQADLQLDIILAVEDKKVLRKFGITKKNIYLCTVNHKFTKKININFNSYGSKNFCYRYSYVR